MATPCPTTRLTHARHGTNLGRNLRNHLDNACGDRPPAGEIVDISENSFLREIARRIGATRGTLDDLLEEDIAEENLDLRPIARYSDRARCLEDMIEVAMVDDDVDLTEKKVLLAAARQAGMPPETIRLLIDEARARMG